MDLKDRIVQTTTELFFENGIKGVTMDIIAETMGMSKRTLYENFADKNDLVNECFSYIIERHEFLDQEIQKKTSNTIEAMLMFYMTGVTSMRKCNKNFISDLKKYHPQVFKQLEEHREQTFCEKVIIALDKGIIEGLIRPEINTEILAIVLKKQMYILEAENSELRKFNLTEIYDTIFMGFARGIVTLKGLKVIDDFIEKNNKDKKIFNVN